MRIDADQFCARAGIPRHSVGHIRRSVPDFPCTKGWGQRGPTGALHFWSADADALAALAKLGFSLTEAAKIIAMGAAVSEIIHRRTNGRN